MKRRIVSAFMCVLMIAALAIPASAGACTHPSQSIERSIIGISRHSESEHKVNYKDNRICNICHAVLDTHYGFYYEAHSMQELHSTHHSNGTHTWRRVCSECGYSRTETFVCPGPPCPIPFSLG